MYGGGGGGGSAVMHNETLMAVAGGGGGASGATDNGYEGGYGGGGGGPTVSFQVFRHFCAYSWLVYVVSHLGYDRVLWLTTIWRSASFRANRAAMTGVGAEMARQVRL